MPLSKLKRRLCKALQQLAALNQVPMQEKFPREMLQKLEHAQHEDEVLNYAANMVFFIWMQNPSERCIVFNMS